MTPQPDPPAERRKMEDAESAARTMSAVIYAARSGDSVTLSQPFARLVESALAYLLAEVARLTTENAMLRTEAPSTRPSATLFDSTRVGLEG